MAGRFKVEGLKELERKMKGLELKMQKKLVRAALKKAAEPILHAARSKAPVDTGLLVSQLKVRTGSSKKRGSITARVVASGKGKNKAFYGSFVEYGHKSGSTAVPAEPFMRPAYDENKERALSIFQSELGKSLDQAAKSA